MLRKIFSHGILQLDESLCLINCFAISFYNILFKKYCVIHEIQILRCSLMLICVLRLGQSVVGAAPDEGEEVYDQLTMLKI